MKQKSDTTKLSTTTHANTLKVMALITSFAIGGALGVYHTSRQRIRELEEANYRQQQYINMILQKNPKSLGKFKCTAYCGCKKCCGHSHGITKSGTVATAKRTIAVDPRVIPLGTTVYIDGVEYVAEDTGRSIKGKRIDIYFNSHEEAVNFGVQQMEVKA